MRITKPWARVLVTVALTILIILSWSKQLDDAAHTATVENFKNALAVAALARAFNGVISVAQGTEVAIQPIGVGVTLSIGEILDPINDLVERFSMLALVASISLGLQLSLAGIVSTPWLSGLLTIFALSYLALMWRPAADHANVKANVKVSATVRYIGQCLAALVFVRFVLVIVLLATHWIDSAFLAERQQMAIDQLSTTATSIEQIGQPQASVEIEQDNFFDRATEQLNRLLESSAQTLDLKSQLSELEQRVANSVEEMINLIVIFLLQTLLLPILTLCLVWWSLKAFWRLNGPPA